MNASPYGNDLVVSVAEWLNIEKLAFDFRLREEFGEFLIRGKHTITLFCIDLPTWSRHASAGRKHPLLPDFIPGDPLTERPTVVLWEDVWYRKNEIVKSRLLALLGFSVRIPARKTSIRRIDKPCANRFLESHHLNGGVSARYRFGLYLQGPQARTIPGYPLDSQQEEDFLIAVAAFAAPKTFFRDGIAHRSGELVRFASHKGTTIVGGLTKLTEHFARLYRPDDIMTYADLEWSTGLSFQKTGFELTGQSEPLTFFINQHSCDRYPLKKLDNKILHNSANNLIEISNAGNLKYVKRYVHKIVTIEEGTPREQSTRLNATPYDIIFVVGPTASGKTALAVRLAYELGGEIISLDSRQVYVGMDIGTGKDLNEYTTNDGYEIPCHLIDIVAPGRPYSVHHFKQDFENIYKALRQDGKPIIACGGSGLYIEAVLNLITKEVTGSPPSILMIGLNPTPRQRKERIETRLKKRLDQGLVEEVRSLLKRGVPEQSLINYGLEYKYVTLFLRNELTYDEMTSALLNEICRFSKRQITFLKKIERNGQQINWI